MKIKLLNLSLRNFKGASNHPNACKNGKDLDIDFDDSTTISGDNASLKTTTFDAFTWLLFGKNSSDAKDFNIKTLDEFNRPIHRLEHEVAATLDVDGRHIRLKKIFKEKWVKKKGAETSELTGHETEHYIDDVPLSMGEYKGRVDMIIKEELAKLITNPNYFNQMKWNERRAVLEAMAGEITNESILDAIANVQNKDSISNLTNILNSGKNLADFKKEIAVKKKKIKDTLETIPTRIDETNRMLPEFQNWTAIEKKIAEKQQEIEAIEAEMEHATKTHESAFAKIREQNAALNKLKIDLSNAQSSRSSIRQNKIAAITSQITGVEQSIASAHNQLKSTDVEIKKHTSKIYELKEVNNGLRTQWNETNADEVKIDPTSMCCPTCKQSLPADAQASKTETLRKNFNEQKERVLAELDRVGKNNKAEIERLEALVAKLQDSIAPINDSIATSERNLSDLKDKKAIEESAPDAPSEQELALQSQIDAFVVNESPVIDNSELKNERTVISSEIDSLKQILTGRDQATKLNARVKELDEEQKTLAQELANLERTEFTIEAFNKAKVETLESRINGKFSLVRFKMFSQNLNGGEEECCECMVSGVPYSDVNTAGKINAGIDIINALCKHYNVNAPVWIDNRESVIRLLPCESQIINLQAVKDFPLTISYLDKQVA